MTNSGTAPGNRTSLAAEELLSKSYYGVESADEKLVAICQKAKRMQTALEDCDLLAVKQVFPDLYRKIEDALAFDPLTSPNQNAQA